MAIAPAAAFAGFKALNTYNKSKAAKKAYKQQAQIADINATQEDIQARNAIEYGQNQVEDYQREVSSFKSSQINALADNGIDVSQGSAIDLLASTEMQAQSDIDTLRYNAALQSWGHQVNKTNYVNQARGLRVQANSINPIFDALLDGAGSFMQAGGLQGLGGGK
ncbi:hypothetical protein F909_03914 [Acinetobacter sp. ANC 3929]|uniref:hypothetical protein n=1 Tax=Acinetobacter sp. ANC 3929 TaxID=1217707 RepID=UPI0002D13067|nr:hypothetical protein [Acinetobacter sp. ANC 3929]ENW78228.1 hypothetical protein F909_03914 [Acinetobacter sp. ANC 3929]